MISNGEQDPKGIGAYDKRPCQKAIKAVDSLNSVRRRCTRLLYSAPNLLEYDQENLSCPIRLIEVNPGREAQELLGVMDPGGTTLVTLWYFKPC